MRRLSAGASTHSLPSLCDEPSKASKFLKPSLLPQAFQLLPQDIKDGDRYEAVKEAALWAQPPVELSRLPQGKASGSGRE